MAKHTAGSRNVIFTNKYGKQVGQTVNAPLSGQAEGKPYALYYTPPEDTTISTFIGCFKTVDAAREALWDYRRKWLSNRKGAMTKLTDSFASVVSEPRLIRRAHFRIDFQPTNQAVGQRQWVGVAQLGNHQHTYQITEVPNGSKAVKAAGWFKLTYQDPKGQTQSLGMFPIRGGQEQAQAAYKQAFDKAYQHAAEIAQMPNDTWQGDAPYIPPYNKRMSVRAALKTAREINAFIPAAQPVELEGNVVLIKVAYNDYYGEPSKVDVFNYVASQYPVMRVIKYAAENGVLDITMAADEKPSKQADEGGPAGSVLAPIGDEKAPLFGEIGQGTGKIAAGPDDSDVEKDWRKYREEFTPPHDILGLKLRTDDPDQWGHPHGIMVWRDNSGYTTLQISRSFRMNQSFSRDFPDAKPRWLPTWSVIVNGKLVHQLRYAQNPKKPGIDIFNHPKTRAAIVKAIKQAKETEFQDAKKRQLAVEGPRNMGHPNEDRFYELDEYKNRVPRPDHMVDERIEAERLMNEIKVLRTELDRLNESETNYGRTPEKPNELTMPAVTHTQLQNQPAGAEYRQKLTNSIRNMQERIKQLLGRPELETYRDTKYQEDFDPRNHKSGKRVAQDMSMEQAVPPAEGQEPPANSIPGAMPPPGTPGGPALDAPQEQTIPLEEALDQLTEAADAIRTNVENGGAIIDGQEVEAVPEAPQAGGPPVATEPSSAQPITAQKKTKEETGWYKRVLERRKQEEQKLDKLPPPAPTAPIAPPKSTVIPVTDPSVSLDQIQRMKEQKKLDNALGKFDKAVFPPDPKPKVAPQDKRFDQPYPESVVRRVAPGESADDFNSQNMTRKKQYPRPMSNPIKHTWDSNPHNNDIFHQLPATNDQRAKGYGRMESVSESMFDVLDDHSTADCSELAGADSPFNKNKSHNPPKAFDWLPAGLKSKVETDDALRASKRKVRLMDKKTGEPVLSNETGKPAVISKYEYHEMMGLRQNWYAWDLLSAEELNQAQQAMGGATYAVEKMRMRNRMKQGMTLDRVAYFMGKLAAGEYDPYTDPDSPFFEPDESTLQQQTDESHGEYLEQLKQQKSKHRDLVKRLLEPLKDIKTLGPAKRTDKIPSTPTSPGQGKDIDVEIGDKSHADRLKSLITDLHMAPVNTSIDEYQEWLKTVLPQLKVPVRRNDGGVDWIRHDELEKLIEQKRITPDQIIRDDDDKTDKKLVQQFDVLPGRFDGPSKGLKQDIGLRVRRHPPRKEPRVQGPTVRKNVSVPMSDATKRDPNELKPGQPSLVDLVKGTGERAESFPSSYVPGVTKEPLGPATHKDDSPAWLERARALSKKIKPKGSEDDMDKEAVDQLADDYYSDYYGEYGRQMTREDRIAARADLVAAVANEIGLDIADSDIIKLVAHLESQPAPAAGLFNKWAQVGGAPDINEMVDMALQLSHTDPAIAKTLDRLTVEYLLRSSGALDKMPLEEQRVIIMRAIRSSKRLYNKIMGIINKNMGRGITTDPLPANDPAMVATAMKIEAEGFKQPKVEKGSDAVKVIEMKDLAADGSEIVPAYIPMRYSNPFVNGVYTYLTVSWAPEDVQVSGQSLLTAVSNYVRSLSGRKDKVDFGFIGQVVVDNVDPQAGTALVHFRTKKPGDATLQVKTTKG